jgi:predicted branched-subunit amino acid permease
LSRTALFQGAREAAGVPAAVLAAGYLGFGALAAGHQLPLSAAVASTLAIWALPGQLILVEMNTLGAPLLAIVLTVALSSARFLPMTLVLMPLMRDARHRGWHYYVTAQLLALTGWTMAMARFPEIARAERLAWFYGFTLVCFAASAAATAAGYLAADLMTPLAKTGLVFMAPMYYLLILVGGIRDRAAALALACGALAGPLAYLASPQWSVLLGGFAGGSLAYAVLRRARRRG